VNLHNIMQSALIAYLALWNWTGNWVSPIKDRPIWGLVIKHHRYAFLKTTADYDYSERGEVIEAFNTLTFSVRDAEGYSFRSGKTDHKRRPIYGRKWRLSWKVLSKTSVACTLPDRRIILTHIDRPRR